MEDQSKRVATGPVVLSGVAGGVKRIKSDREVGDVSCCLSSSSASTSSPFLSPNPLRGESLLLFLHHSAGLQATQPPPVTAFSSQQCSGGGGSVGWFDPCK